MDKDVYIHANVHVDRMAFKQNKSYNYNSITFYESVRGKNVHANETSVFLNFTTVAAK